MKKLTDREHILLRPAMYIGSVNHVKTTEFLLIDQKIKEQEIRYVPGLIKIINEIIDNSVDVAIKTDFKSSNKISVIIKDDCVEISDNGTGIPVIKNTDGQYYAELAWGHAKAGTNFEDDENRTHIGMNGIGSYCSCVFSDKFIGITQDGKHKQTLTFESNGILKNIDTLPSKSKTGVAVKFYPDLERFGLTKIDETHKKVIEQRLINLSMSFPCIDFIFNNTPINIPSFKKYVSLFADDYEIYQCKDFQFAIVTNSDDDFKQVSYVNGLKIPDGGTHIDILSNNITNGLREKLSKYKALKPGDIKNKLMIIAFMRNLKNPKFNSQSKEKITNSIKEINDYFNSVDTVDYDKIVNKLYRNKNFIDPIVEVFKIKEELKRRQELKGLEKPQKKIKSDKYLPSIGAHKYLVITEGFSAVAGIMPVLGRKEFGYYTLKGKPLNSYTADTKKFTQNKELTELFQIIKNENYSKIILACDADLDGLHIIGLMVGFFMKYLKKSIETVGVLNTPVILVTKSDKPVRWFYDLNQLTELKQTEKSHYVKGLGSWNTADLKHIINADGLENMIKYFNIDDEGIIDDWLGNNSEPRKIYILDNTFNIADL